MTSTASHPGTDAATLLQQHFGFGEFRAGQREVIDHLLAGRSAAAVFPTGGGKSLCYQLPALALEGVTVVVSPLIALMKDQIDGLTRRGIAAARLDSSVGYDDQRAAVARLRQGDLRLLYVAPERFNNERFREMLRGVRVSLFAVDEAHCISEWGHNFRPDYLKLPAYAEQYGAERVLALTATATPKVLDDICAGFAIDRGCAVRTGFYRPNLTVLTTPVEDHERDRVLVQRLSEREPGPTIVYVTTQKTAEAVAQRLAEQGFDAKHYHAGMKPDDRGRVQEWFLKSDKGIVCATIAFGMGIDKPDIRYVYHYNLPKSLENFAQEIGRAGRDGEPSTCEMLVCIDDLSTLENFALSDTPSPDAVRSFVRAIFAEEERFDVSQFGLSRDHDIKPIVVRTLLTYLELLGFLEGGTPFYAAYRFKPLMPSKDILAQFQGERRSFLAALLKQARKARTWFTLDATDAANVLGVPRDRIVAAIDYLGEKGMLEVSNEGIRLRYQRLKTPAPADLDALAKKLHQRTVEREQREIERLNQVVELSEQPGCQVKALCEHFGEKRPEPCGHCTRCLKQTGPGPAKTQAAKRRTVDEAQVRAIWDEGEFVRDQYVDVLADDDAYARFLCGLGTPAMSRRRLTKHAWFGKLEHVPLRAVLKSAQSRT